MDPVRKGILIFCGFCLLLLFWYLIGDRFTPFTSQARVNAFVVPIAPQVKGIVLAVDVTNNQFVAKGQRLAQIDPEQYELAVASASAQLAVAEQNLRASSATVSAADAAVASARAQATLTAQNLRASSAAVAAAAAALESAKANLVKDRQNAIRLKRIAEEDPGAVSRRRIEIADASLQEAEAGVQRAEADLARATEQRGPMDDNNPQVLAARATVERAAADLEKAREQRGPTDTNNPQILAARAALDQARRDLRNATIVAPADGLVTDVRVDAGNFAAVGQPLMTFVAFRDVWVQADLTENNLGHVKPGDPVELTLDVAPGTLLRGKVRSITYGVSALESTSKPGALPTVQTTRNWLRDAQRFPVLIDLDDRQQATTLGVRVGSQVSVIVYAGDSTILNALGALLIRLVSFLSYVY